MPGLLIHHVGAIPLPFKPDGQIYVTFLARLYVLAPLVLILRTILRKANLFSYKVKILKSSVLVFKLEELKKVIT